MDNQVQASILEMAKGAIMEQVDIEVSKIVGNIIDVNTEAKKKRTLNLTVDFIPSADRQTVVISANAKSKLLPNNAIQTSLYVAVNPGTGELCAMEMVPQVPGQMAITGDEQETPRILKMVVGGKE